MKAPAFDPQAITRTWTAFQKSVGGLAPIRSERDHDRAVALLNELLDIVGEQESHPLASLMEVLGELVEDYESRKVPIADSTPAEALRFLMDSNGLTQVDLKNELGGQSVVSTILSGKRAINARQARSLAARFGVSPAVFV